MNLPASISPEEAANRLAIRQLIDAYAHCADSERQGTDGPLRGHFGF